jgi:hypothetical protein
VDQRPLVFWYDNKKGDISLNNIAIRSIYVINFNKKQILMRLKILALAYLKFQKTFPSGSGIPALLVN